MNRLGRGLPGASGGTRPRDQPRQRPNGVANAAGSKGGYANCRYAMSNPSLGTGSCKFSDGAVYTRHVGQ